MPYPQIVGIAGWLFAPDFGLKFHNLTHPQDKETSVACLQIHQKFVKTRYFPMSERFFQLIPSGNHWSIEVNESPMNNESTSIQFGDFSASHV